LFFSDTLFFFVSPSHTNGLHAGQVAEKVREAVGKLTKNQLAQLDEAMKLRLALE
jgi:hypothetical protein